MWRFVRAAFQLKGQRLRCDRLASAIASIRQSVGGTEVGVRESGPLLGAFTSHTRSRQTGKP
jgi:hypothetical protein